MDPPGTIAIVGRGRLGRTVLHALGSAGLPVTGVGRGESIPAAGTTWLLVPDRAIAEVARTVPPGGVVLHSSGSLGPDALAPHEHAAVLHPIMSFSGSASPHPVPATVSGSPVAVARAKELADTLGWDPVPFDGDRALYHAACVIAGNFGATVFAEACKAMVLAGRPARGARAPRRSLGPRSTTRSGSGPGDDRPADEGRSRGGERPPRGPRARPRAPLALRSARGGDRRAGAPKRSLNVGCNSSLRGGLSAKAAVVALGGVGAILSSR